MVEQQREIGRRNQRRWQGQWKDDSEGGVEGRKKARISKMYNESEFQAQKLSTFTHSLALMKFLMKGR